MYYLKWHNISAARYYCLHIQRDLFRHWSVICIWGGIGNRLGGMRNYSFPSAEEALEFIESVKQKRHNRGYLLATENVLDDRQVGLIPSLKPLLWP